MSRLILPLMLCLLSPLALWAENWPGWRGPRGDGSSLEKNVPLSWSLQENVLWNAKIPGIGHSSPIVQGDRVYLTSCDEEKEERLLLCLDRKDGSTLWKKNVMQATLERKHHLNSFASATPATDGKHVYVAFLDMPDMVVVCYTMDGAEVWRKRPGKLLSVHGFCSSPVLHKDLIILNGDQDAKNKDRAYIVALDKTTGEEKWRADRPNRTRSYCTPILIPCPVHKGRTQLVLSGSKCVTGYDADTGKLQWIHNGPTEQYVASLVYHQDVLFLTTGFPQFHLMGIRPDGQGDITRSRHIAWHIPHSENENGKGASYVPSPIAHQGHFFVISDKGFLGCIEAKTGKRLWQKKLGERHSASPVLAEGRMIIPDDKGKVWIVKANPEFELERRIDMKEGIFGSPAISEGRLYLRTVSRLFCIGDAKPR